MGNGITFEWVGQNVIIKSFSGAKLYTVQNARSARFEGENIIVRGNCFETIKFSPNGTRSFL